MIKRIKSFIFLFHSNKWLSIRLSNNELIIDSSIYPYFFISKNNIKNNIEYEIYYYGFTKKVKYKLLKYTI